MAVVYTHRERSADHVYSVYNNDQVMKKRLLIYDEEVK